MSEWIEAYNTAGVKNESTQPCQEMLREFSHKFIVCSNLTRSTHSAKIIGYQSPHLIDGMFREAELPKIQLPMVRLTPHIWSMWSMVFRAFWFVGIFPNAESVEKFKPRVSLATEKLIQLAKNHDSILLIGHGIINRFLATIPSPK